MNPTQLKELAEQLVANPESIEKLTDEEVLELRKYVNPYGGIIGTRKSYAVMNIVNWRDRYLRRLHMTALTGYLYRCLDEYENSDEAQPSARAFVEKHFRFDPDRHVRAEGKANDVPKESIGSGPTSAAEALQAQPTIDHVLATYQITKEATNYLSAVLRCVGVLKDIVEPHLSDDNKESIEKHLAISRNKVKQAHDMLGEVEGLVATVSKEATKDAQECIVPADLFYHFDRYLTNHYEQLKAITEARYCERDDIDYSVTYYCSRSTKDAAVSFVKQHAEEFKSDVFVVENGAVTILGPYNQNRERAEFYSKNTETLTMMFDQVEKDHKLGQDLMKKKVKAKKAQNIREAGPHNKKGLQAYAEVGNLAAEHGVMTVEEQEKIEAQKYAEAIPEDAIAVDIFHPSKDGKTLNKSTFYTQAEAPLHLEGKNNPYTDKYQPKRDEDEGL